MLAPLTISQALFFLGRTGVQSNIRRVPDPGIIEAGQPPHPPQAPLKIAVEEVLRYTPRSVIGAGMHRNKRDCRLVGRFQHVECW